VGGFDWRLCFVVGPFAVFEAGFRWFGFVFWWVF